MTTPLEQLLVVQEHDSAIDHLRHRRATLPERAALTRAEAVIRELESPIAEVRGRLDAITRDVKRLEDEASSASAKVTEVEGSMYSGSITSPRELQAMQGEVEQLRRHQRALEDRELELMESQEAHRRRARRAGGPGGAAEAEASAARAAVAEQERLIDAEIATETRRADRGGGGDLRQSARGLRRLPGRGEGRRCGPARGQHVPGLPAHDPVHRGRPHPQGRPRRRRRPLRQLRRHPRPELVSTDPFPGLEPAIRTIRIFCDGGSRGNPGPAGDRRRRARREPRAGAPSRVGERDHRRRHEQRRRVHRVDPRRSRSPPNTTRARVEVRADSQLLIRQLEGRYRVKNAGLVPLHRRAQELLRPYREVDLQHVRREDNTDADALVNAALDAAAG